MFRSALLSQSLSRTLPPFDKLRDVCIDYEINVRLFSPRRNTSDVLPFLHLRNLEKFRAAMDNPLANNPCPWPTSSMPDLSTLTSLSLVLGREPLLDEILSITKPLECFRWEWYYRADARRPDDHVHSSRAIGLDRFTRALGHARGTLTELFIACRFDVGGHGTDISGPSFKGSLKALNRFERLSTLEAPLPWLVGTTVVGDVLYAMSHILPPGLKYLRISDDLYALCKESQSDGLENTVRGWLRQGDWRLVMPRLRRVTMVARDSREKELRDGFLNRETRKTLEDMCARAGLECAWVDMDSCYIQQQD